MVRISVLIGLGLDGFRFPGPGNELFPACEDKRTAAGNRQWEETIRENYQTGVSQTV